MFFCTRPLIKLHTSTEVNIIIVNILYLSVHLSSMKLANSCKATRDTLFHSIPVEKRSD